jgi:hypothetical protein
MLLVRLSLMIALAAAVSFLVAFQAPAAPASDPQAAARFEAMFAKIGGRAAWAEARSLYLHYRQWPTGQYARLQEERAWRDLVEPKERMEFHWRDADGKLQQRGRGFWDGRMWRRREGVTEIEGKELADFLAFWSRDFYTMFRRIARNDADLKHRFVAPNRIETTDAAGRALGWWDIDEHGNLMRWGSTFNEEETLSYVYGPVRDFGAIAFPAWGASSDGTFRFEYADVQISSQPLPDAVFASREQAPPENIRLRSAR